MNRMNDSIKHAYDIADVLATADMPLINPPLNKAVIPLAENKGTIIDWGHAMMSGHAKLVFAAGSIEDGFQTVPILQVAKGADLSVLAHEFSPGARSTDELYKGITISMLRRFSDIPFTSPDQTYGIALVPDTAKHIVLGGSCSIYYPLAFSLGLFGYFGIDNPHGTGFVQLNFPECVGQPRLLSVNDFYGWHPKSKGPEEPINSDVAVVATRYMKLLSGEEKGIFRHTAFDSLMALKVLTISPDETAEQVKPKLEKLL